MNTVTMDKFGKRINPILLTGLIFFLTLSGIVGCKSSAERKKDKFMVSLSFHLEVPRDGSNRNYTIQALRSNPFAVNVEVAPFVDPSHIQSAALVDTLGGYAIQVTLNNSGVFRMQNVTGTNRQKRIAVQSLNSDNEQRWLAAPKLTQPINNGVFIFTPDVDSREEAEKLVRGVNNMVKKIERKNRW